MYSKHEIRRMNGGSVSVHTMQDEPAAHRETNKQRAQQYLRMAFGALCNGSEADRAMAGDVQRLLNGWA